MMKVTHPVHRAAGLAIAWLVCSAAQAHYLTVDLRTDFVPVADFSGVEVRLNLLSDSTTFVADPQLSPAFAGQDFFDGVRVARFEGLNSGEYRVTLRLLDHEGRVVAQQRAPVLVESDHGITRFINRAPNPEVTREWVLVDDRDGDGLPGVGDAVQFDVTIRPRAGETVTYADYSDDLAFGLQLIPGTVFTSHGAVIRGNVAGDERVQVIMADVSPAQDVRLNYAATITGELASQGLLSAESGSSRRHIFTDDPQTAALDDPTLLPLSCPALDYRDALEKCEVDLADSRGLAAACRREREQLERDLESCRNNLSELEVTLAALLADDDEDGVPALRDDCGDTPAGVAVDAHGCSRVAFCSMQAPGPACQWADWRQDETDSEEPPRDCRTASQGGVRRCKATTGLDF